MKIKIAVGVSLMVFVIVVAHILAAGLFKKDEAPALLPPINSPEAVIEPKNSSQAAVPKKNVTYVEIKKKVVNDTPVVEPPSIKPVRNTRAS